MGISDNDLEVVLLLGSNLGNKEANLDLAKENIQSNISPILLQSSVYETDAWGRTDQPSFLNQIVVIKSRWSPVQILEELLFIEKKLGRERMMKWGERTIDIDILYYGDKVVQEPRLVIPHPELHHRKFTLLPLSEILPDFIHPLFKRSQKELLAMCTDPLKVIKLK